MILCSRCPYEALHLSDLLEHHDTVHGGWRTYRILRPRRDESNFVRVSNGLPSRMP